MYQLFLWHLYLMVLRGATSLLGALEGVGPENRDFFLGQMALASLMPFQGPKKSWFSGLTPSNAPRNDVAPLKIIMYRAIKTTGTFIVILSLGVFAELNRERAQHLAKTLKQQ
jgi:hypothetical protein